MPLWSLLLAACSPATPAPDGALVEVEDQAGLSDLAIDASGALWAVAERPAALVQIEPTARTLPIGGLPCPPQRDRSAGLLLGALGPRRRGEPGRRGHVRGAH